MSQVLLFHHAQGLTDGVRAFAEELRGGGHEVTTPDLFDGRTFDTIEDGVAHAQELGFGAILSAAIEVAEGMPPDLVYAGFSLGVLPAQRLTQQRAGARAALLYHSAIPLEEFGGGWPDGCPLQVHLAADDPWEDLDAVRAVAEDAGGELFVYPGDGHLFTDSSLRGYEPEASRLVIERSLDLLERLHPVRER